MQKIRKIVAITVALFNLISISLFSACENNTHSHQYTTTTVDATCTQEGYVKYICDCGHTYQEKIEIKEHTFSTWKTIKSETCEIDGSKTRSCNCGETETQVVKATGHKWQSATCTNPKTCSTCKKTEGKALGHNKGSNGYCTRCNEKLAIDMNTVVGNPNDCSTLSFFGFCYYKNSVNGIKVCWGGENLSEKTINYYTITIYFYNSVGDPAYSEITGKSSKSVKYVGPIAPGEDLIIFGIVDYVPVCSKVLIGEITLEYADGTSDTGWYGWSTTYKNSSIK